MKITDYRDAYIQTVTAGMSVDDALVSLKQVLQKNKRFSLYPRILKSILKKIDQKQNMTVVTLATEKDFHVFETKIKQILHTFNAQERPQISIQKNIIGGFIIKNNATVVDASYKRILLDTYHRIIKDI